MHPIKAFVGHSFAEEDEGVVTAILNILRRVAELHQSFVWEDAAHPEPKGVDAKVLQRFGGKNLFIAICTKKERIIANAALHAPRSLFGAALVGTVSRRREGATPTPPSLLGSDETKPRDCLMWVSDSEGQITILEDNGGAFSNLHKLNRT